MEQLEAYDLGMLYWFTSWRGPYLNWSLLALTRLGDFVVLLNAAVAGTVLFLALGRRRLAYVLLGVALLGFGLDGGLKYTVNRPRPNLANALAEPPSQPSFPSGHAMGSMAVYGSMGLLLSRALGKSEGPFVAYGGGLSIVVGLTRVMIGVHYPFDVLAGWIGGVLLVTLAGALAGPPVRAP